MHAGHKRMSFYTIFLHIVVLLFRFSSAFCFLYDVTAYACVCGYATPYKSNLSRHQSRCESVHPQSSQTAEPHPTSPSSEQDQMSPVSEKASCIDDDDFEAGGPYVEEEILPASSST